MAHLVQRIQENTRVLMRRERKEPSADSDPRMPRQGSQVAPFILGTILGGIFGAALGTALSPHTRGFVVGLYHLVSRRLSSSDRDQLRFELLLQ